MASCDYFAEYMALQQEELRLALDENKWYLSEKAGRDVGAAYALDDFCRHHLDRFAHEFRLRFCGSICPKRATCTLAVRVEGLSGANAGKPGAQA